MKKNIAILWDIENVTPPSSDSLSFEGIWDYAESMGQVVVAYSYADWSKPGFRNLGFLLAGRHFYLIHIPSKRKRSNKNGADMQLVSDAVELLRYHSHIDTFILITGDSDFRPLLLTLRKAGKEIHIICDIKTASQDLLMIADSFKDYRELIPDSDEEEAEKDAGAPPVSRPKEYWYERLAETASILLGENKPANMGTTKIRMKMLNRGFDEKSLGYKQWSRFISAAVKEHYVEIVDKDNQTLIYPGSHYKRDKGTLQLALKILIETLLALDEGKPSSFHAYSTISPILSEKGVNIRHLGFSQFKQFVSSAEARGLVETKVEHLSNYVRRQ